MSIVKFEPVRLEGRTLVLIDQRKLPNQFRLIRCRTSKEVWHAIRELAVRGAPAIGIAGAYGLYLGSLEKRVSTRSDWVKTLRGVGTFLKTSRPTTVNLAWAIDRIINRVEQSKEQNVGKLKELVHKEAELIHEEDQALCKAIGQAGVRLVHSGDSILTHCNAGGLATSGFGTALRFCLRRRSRENTSMCLRLRHGRSFRAHGLPCGN